MNGFHVFHPSSSLHGVLFADDFDLPDSSEPVPSQEEVPAPIPPDPVYTLAELEAARLDGYSQGRTDAVLDFTAQQESTIAATLIRIGTLLADSRDSMKDTLDASAEAVAGLVFATLSTLFPRAASVSAVDEILLRIKHLFRGQIPLGDLQVTVAPEIQQKLEHAFADPVNGLSNVRVLSRAGLSPGDADVSWSGGIARQDHHAIQRAIHGILAKLNLVSPPAAPVTAAMPRSHITPAQFIPTMGRFETESHHAG